MRGHEERLYQIASRHARKGPVAVVENYLRASDAVGDVASMLEETEKKG